MGTTLAIPNYEVAEKIAESPQAAIYKAYHKKNPSRPLVLKVLKAVSLLDHKKTHFEQRIEHLRVLNDPLVSSQYAGGAGSVGFRDGGGSTCYD